MRDETPWADIIATSTARSTVGLRIAGPARRSGAIARAQHRRVTTAERTTVTFDNDASGDATVIDVEAPDGVGMLYRITEALSDLDLDIRSAKVQTLGAHVVDAFYVVHRSGAKIVDADLMAEIERAVLHAVRQGVEFATS